MIKVRIEYLDFNDHGGISQYAITVKGTSLQSIEREFYDRIGGWDAYFTEVSLWCITAKTAATGSMTIGTRYSIY